MKVRSLRIGSFGGVKDREMSFDRPMTVIYGKNETGKTSLMEFIRSTLFPDNQRKHYPEYRNSDRGELDVEMDNGDRFTIVRDGKKVQPGRMPSDTVPMEPTLYRSLFAMSPEDLRDSKVISSGDIKSRFLTVPGGEGLPEVISDIESESKKLMSADRKSSSTVVSKLNREIEENDSDINDHAQAESMYANLVEEKEGLAKEAVRLKEQVARNSDNAAAVKLRQSQKENVDNLNQLKKRKEELAPSAAVKEGDVMNYTSLKSALEQRTEAKDSALRAEKELSGSTGGIEPKVLLDNERTIEDLYGKIDSYKAFRSTEDEFRRNASAERGHTTTYTQPKQKDKLSPLLLGIGALAMIVCLGIGVAVNPLIILAGVAVLAVCVIISVKMKGKNAPAPAPVQVQTDNGQSQYWLKQANDMARKYNELDAELEAVAKNTGIDRVSFVADTELLHKLLSNARMLKAASVSRAQAVSAEREAAANLRMFLADYGGEEKFLQLAEEKKEYDRVCERIDVLEKSISSSGYSETEAVPEAEAEEDPQEKLTEVNRKIGDIDRQLKYIFNDSTMEDLLDMRHLLRTDLFGNVKRWAVLSLAGTMIDEACDSIYSEVQPGVITTADSLLRTMTCGRYGLEMDMRSNEVKAVSGTEGKAEGQWSTGLGDQVYLSIKLAIAKEMSKDETLPILLDDVLQMFDSERKMNACRALAEFSEGQQTIFFTCDAETRDMMKEVGCDVREIAA
ncbi:MAG: AAA family ATPase [Candidatus Methanomethylophilaceae archaeon]|jgi:uncharacterized protein YhaN